MSVTDEEIRAELEGESDGDGFVARLEDRVGTDLRCVVEYDESGRTVRYHREDVQRDEFDIVVEEMKRRLRAAESSSDAAPRTLVSCYDDVSVVHVRRTDRENVAILLNADATPRIRAFARGLRDRQS